MSYSEDVGAVSARYRPGGAAASVTYPSGTHVRFTAPGSVTNGQYGLFEWNMTGTPGGARQGSRCGQRCQSAPWSSSLGCTHRGILAFLTSASRPLQELGPRHLDASGRPLVPGGQEFRVLLPLPGSCQ